jgi:hypothetical protein
LHYATSRRIGLTAATSIAACDCMKKSILRSISWTEWLTLFFAGPDGEPGQDSEMSAFVRFNPAPCRQYAIRPTHVAAPTSVALGDQAVRVIRLHVVVDSLALG